MDAASRGCLEAIHTVSPPWTHTWSLVRAKKTSAGRKPRTLNPAWPSLLPSSFASQQSGVPYPRLGHEIAKKHIYNHVWKQLPLPPSSHEARMQTWVWIPSLYAVCTVLWSCDIWREQQGFSREIRLRQYLHVLEPRPHCKSLYTLFLRTFQHCCLCWEQDNCSQSGQRK